MTTDKKPIQGGFIVLLVKLLPKLGTLLSKIFTVLIKVLKGGKFVMAGTTFASYVLIFNWKFALTLMAGIFIHELGHIRAMKAYGMKTKGVYFLPFLGAAAVAEEDFLDRKAETVIGLWGPVYGLITAMIAFAIYAQTGSPLAAGIAAWLGVVNLFNLLPIKPLDGGRILVPIALSVSPRFGLSVMVFGMFLAVYILLKFHMSLFGLFLIVGFFEFLGERRRLPDIKTFRKNLIIVLVRELNDPMPPIFRVATEENILAFLMALKEKAAPEAFDFFTFDVALKAGNMGWLQKGCSPEILKTWIEQEGSCEQVVRKVLDGTFQPPQTQRTAPIPLKDVAVVATGSLITFGLLAAITYFSGIDPASQAAFKVFSE